MLIDKLSSLVENNNLSQSEFQAIAYRLSPQQERLFLHLSEHGETDTITLRSICSIGNISDVAKSLNGKLSNNKDSRRIVCLLKPNINQFDEIGLIGHWLIVGEPANDSH
jgi:hypothetical protein